MQFNLREGNNLFLSQHVFNMNGIEINLVGLHGLYSNLETNIERL